jgi:hypothetical protein
MNESQQSEQQMNQSKLEWLEPSFELLSDPEGSGGASTEVFSSGAS